VSGHEELAVAIIHPMWCGWLSQAKTNSKEVGKRQEVCTKLRHDFASYISNQWIRLVLPKEYKKELGRPVGKYRSNNLLEQRELVNQAQIEGTSLTEEQKRQQERAEQFSKLTNQVLSYE
jgi:DNA-binding helix-hairpin-helix protein with protein kinase domain